MWLILHIKTMKWELVHTYCWKRCAVKKKCGKIFSHEGWEKRTGMVITKYVLYHCCCCVYHIIISLILIEMPFSFITCFKCSSFIVCICYLYYIVWMYVFCCYTLYVIQLHISWKKTGKFNGKNCIFSRTYIYLGKCFINFDLAGLHANIKNWGFFLDFVVWALKSILCYHNIIYKIYFHYFRAHQFPLIYFIFLQFNPCFCLFCLVLHQWDKFCMCKLVLKLILTLFRLIYADR